MRDFGYNTNLAAEYYVLSVLYRKGFNAYLTLGNKKAIDIVIDHGTRTTTIDVKGMVSKTLWPMDNFSGGRNNHWIALVTFQNRIDDHTVIPQTFILPSSKVRNFLYRNPKGTRKGIRHAAMRTRGKKYLEAWHLLKQ
jgi:hypothetical protein